MSVGHEKLEGWDLGVKNWTLQFGSSRKIEVEAYVTYGNRMATGVLNATTRDSIWRRDIYKLCFDSGEGKCVHVHLEAMQDGHQHV